MTFSMVCRFEGGPMDGHVTTIEGCKRLDGTVHMPKVQTTRWPGYLYGFVEMDMDPLESSMKEGLYRLELVSEPIEPLVIPQVPVDWNVVFGLVPRPSVSRPLPPRMAAQGPVESPCLGSRESRSEHIHRCMYTGSMHVYRPGRRAHQCACGTFWSDREGEE